MASLVIYDLLILLVVVIKFHIIQRAYVKGLSLSLTNSKFILFIQAPWYKNFAGSIEQVEPNKYNCYGACNVVDNRTVEITELPVKSWTSNYKESILESYLHGTEKAKPCIT